MYEFMNKMKNYTTLAIAGALLFSAACGGDKRPLPVIDTPYGRGAVAEKASVRSPETVDRYNVKMANGKYVIGFQRNDGTWLVYSQPDGCSDIPENAPPCSIDVRNRVVGVLEQAKSIDDTTR
jgi:hypothetical protein